MSDGIGIKMPYIREFDHPIPIAICKAIGVDVNSIEAMTIRFSRDELCMVYISKKVKEGELDDIVDKYVLKANKINDTGCGDCGDDGG